MSNISKTQAEEIAVKLTATQQKEYDKARKETQTFFTEKYLATIPEEVKTLFEKYPSYFESRKDFQLQGNGFNWQYVNTLKEVPCAKRTYSPEPKEAEKLLKLLTVEESKRFELEKLRSEIEIALNSLRTFKRINESFPEASKYLSLKTSTALAVNLSEIREKLK